MEKRVFRRRFPVYPLLAVITVLMLWNFNLISYGVRQLKGQLHIVWHAVPVDKVIDDPSTPDSIRLKLGLIKKIRQYAVDSLGLKPSKNYSTYYDQKGKPAIWVITASDPFALNAYEWHFPFLGTVSYKGFFDRRAGLEEATALRRRGYDVEYSPTGGWSTLGWFTDPVLSNMLRRSDGQIAELIIHELTHGTFYYPDSVNYNENLATFIGEQGALRFLASAYGDSSMQLRRYRESQEDEMIFGTYMVRACSRLDSLYNVMDTTANKTNRYLTKFRFIASIVTGINQLPLHDIKHYVFKLPETKLPDNAWFMGFRRYRGDLSFLEAQLQVSNGDLKKMIGKMKH